jgi:hypothetical protein
MKNEAFSKLQTDFDASFVEENEDVSYGVLDPSQVQEFDLGDISQNEGFANTTHEFPMNQIGQFDGFQGLGVKEREAVGVVFTPPTS